MRKALTPFRNIFPDELPPTLPPSHLRRHSFHIDLKQPLPNKRVMYKADPVKSASLIEIVQQLETVGFIKHKMVPYASPSFLVSKKIVDDQGNETKTGRRLVVDYRTLNAHTQVPISPFSVPRLTLRLGQPSRLQLLLPPGLALWFSSDSGRPDHTGPPCIHNSSWNLRKVGHALWSIRMPNLLPC